MINKISIAFPLSYNDRGAHDKYIPMIEELGENVEHIYGIKKTKNCQYKVIHKRQVLSRIPSFFSWHIINPMRKLFRYPRYYIYLSNIVLFDMLFSYRIANDKSTVVFTSPLLPRTVKLAKKKGKIVIIEAGNSEPNREYNRINNEYKIFGIQNRYIYGDPIYKNKCLDSLEFADRIIVISEVSLNTYINACYARDKLKLISLAGTDFVKQAIINISEKQKAFISTAFHSFIKGTQRLLIAWKHANITNIPLLIVGNICEDLSEFIEKYGPFENVIFVGAKSDLSDWYKSYNAVGILLSLSEGAVRVTPEMMSFGFPMITSEDATCDLIKNGYNGIIVNPLDEQQIIQSLKYFADDWKRVNELNKNVIDSVSSRSVKDYSLDLAKYLKTFL